MTKTDINKILEKALLPLEVDLRELFERKLEEYDLTKSKFASLTNIDRPTLDEILSGNAKQPSLINVLKIISFLEIDINEAIPAILKNQSPENLKSIHRAEKLSFVAKNFDIKTLSKIGFLSDNDDIDYIQARFLSFFGYGSPEEYERQLGLPLLSKSKRNFSDKMKDFWVKSAYTCFKDIQNPNEYDREALKDIIAKIKPYCQDIDTGLLTVCKALYNVGVTVIVQNHLTLTQVRGGTFIVDGKPCIVLTDLNKKYTTIWETLLHELHHVLFDFEAIEKNLYHLSGEPDLYLIEDKAEKFSLEYFCGEERYFFIKPHIYNHYIVSKYATEWQIHPSFIYSYFRYYQEKYYNKNYYGAFTTYFPDYFKAIKKLKPINWKEESLQQAAADIKQALELNLEHEK